VVSVSVAGAADAVPRSSSHAAGVSLEGIMFVDLIGWFGTAVRVGKKLPFSSLGRSLRAMDKPIEEAKGV
jgi:hypothetical protein